MADNKKYYYMRLKDNYFDSEKQIALESLPDGYLYSNILLKLYLLSLKHEGRLMVNGCIPYNAKMIANATRHTDSTVRQAMIVFEKLGLIEKLDSGAIYMLDIQNFIGQASTEADRVREYQRKINSEKSKQAISGSTNGVEIYEKSTPEIRDKSIDLRYSENRYLDTREQSKDTTTTKSDGGGDGEPDQPNLSTIEAYASNNLCILNSTAYEELVSFKEIFPDEMIKYAIDEANAHGSRQWAYVKSVLRRWMDCRIATLADAKANDEAFRKSKEKPKDDEPLTDFDRDKWG